MQESEYHRRLSLLLEELEDAKAEGDEIAVEYVERSIERLDKIVFEQLEAEVQREAKYLERYRPDGSLTKHYRVWPMRPYFSQPKGGDKN